MWCVSFKIPWIELTFKMVKMFFGAANGPNEGNEKEKEVF